MNNFIKTAGKILVLGCISGAAGIGIGSGIEQIIKEKNVKDNILQTASKFQDTTKMGIETKLLVPKNDLKKAGFDENEMEVFPKLLDTSVGIRNGDTTEFRIDTTYIVPKTALTPQ